MMLMKAGGEFLEGINKNTIMIKGFAVLVFIFYLLLSCCSGPGGGTLGALKVRLKDGCNSKVAVSEIIELSNSEEFSVPDSLIEYCNWEERGFDFFVHWTVFFEYGDNKWMVWFSEIQDENKYLSIAIRANFDFENEKWIYAKDMLEKEGEELDDIFETSFLTKLSCWER